MIEEEKRVSVCNPKKTRSHNRTSLTLCRDISKQCGYSNFLVETNTTQGITASSDRRLLLGSEDSSRMTTISPGILLCNGVCPSSGGCASTPSGTAGFTEFNLCATASATWIDFWNPSSNRSLTNCSVKRSEGSIVYHCELEP